MIVLVLLFHLITIFQKCSSQATIEAELKDFLYNNYEKAVSENCTKFINTEWDYITDQKNETKSEIFSKTKRENEAFNMEYWDKYFQNLNPNDYKDEKIKRQLKILGHLEEMRTAKVRGDPNDLWSYESPDIFKEIDNLWKQVEPLFMELRKYMGRKLKEKFGKITNYESIENVKEALRPFPKAKMVDNSILTAALQKQKFKVSDMFHSADAFFTSMGLLPSDVSYDVTKGAIIENPTDGRSVRCEATAWDFCDRKTFRIKMCAKVTAEDLFTIVHELGHIQYFLQYAQQPYIFRTGANPAFHEAISATITLSYTTPKHLKKIGLLNNLKETKEAHINYLMDLALEKVAYLPFATFSQEQWRSNIQYGKVEWNNHWYQKQYPEIKSKSDKAVFDPNVKVPIPHKSSNIAYFVAHILQFQMYKSLCMAAGEYDSKNKKVLLHQCDFYQSKEAGKKLSAGLALGSSGNWRNVLEKITGETKMDVSGLLEYFGPLHKFLTKENSEDETEDDSVPDIMRESNSVGTMGSTVYFVLLIEIIACICIRGN